MNNEEKRNGWKGIKEKYKDWKNNGGKNLVEGNLALAETNNFPQPQETKLKLVKGGVESNQKEEMKFMFLPTLHQQVKSLMFHPLTLMYM